MDVGLDHRRPPCDQCHARRIRCRNTSSQSCQACTNSNLDCTRKLVRKKRGPKPSKLSSTVLVDFEESTSENPATVASASVVYTDTIGTGSFPPANHVESDTPSPEGLYPRRVQLQAVRDVAHSITVNELANFVIEHTGHDATQMDPSRLRQLRVMKRANKLNPGSLYTENPGTTSNQSTISTPTHDVHDPPDAISLAIALGLPHRYGPIMLECVDTYFSRLYHPIPVVHQGWFLRLLRRPSTLTISQRSFVLSLCAAAMLRSSCLSGEAIDQAASEIGYRFIEQSLRLRSDVDYMEALTPIMVVEAYHLHLAYACLSQPKSARQFLREAICLAMELGLHKPGRVHDEISVEAICVDRTIALLFVTERATAILGEFATILFRAPPSLPTASFDEHDRHTLEGFRCLYSLFSLLDADIVEYWFSGKVEHEWQKAWFHERLATIQAHLSDLSFCGNDLDDFQRADVMVSHQWIRHFFWQVSMRLGFLSSRPEIFAYSFDFPVQLSKDLCLALQSIPEDALKAHHFSIYCKIFEVAYSLMDVLTISGSSTNEAGSYELKELFRYLSTSPITNMSFVQILLQKGS